MYFSTILKLSTILKAVLFSILKQKLENAKNLHISLDLSYNNLSGEISASLGNLLKLEALDLSHNQLTREVPPRVGDMSSLGVLDLSYNHLQEKLENFK
ncbi:hypothetical protein AHAS_Ahas17G0089300 [Arachis hypogaea]